ncbi:MAG TPA: hypothetical protein PKX07_02090, partial [Aggregatilineales bacterium]|nr:hypothetical protein [Aggregatilineales bacterium]
MSVIESLDAIKAQFQNGEHEDALAAVDAYLERYNDDPDARLLKAEICLKLDTHPGYVGQTLVDLESDLGDSLAFRVLQSRVEQTVSRKMQEGRAQLRRSRATALTCFE